MTRVFSALTALVLAAAPAEAQGLKPVIKYGKWVLAAGAVGMNLLAARAHDRAEEAFDGVEARCGLEPRRCDLNVQGSYSDAEIETLYQHSLRYDRQARRWLIGGETALLGAAAIFVWELTRRTHRPDNIPFEPEIRSLRQATGVGVRFSF